MGIKNIQDHAVRVAASRALGRRVESRADLEQVSELTVYGAQSVEDIEWCPGLQRLTLVGAGAEIAAGLSRLPSAIFRELRIACAAIDRLDFLDSLRELYELEINFTLAEDAAPIAALPKLRRVRLLGNPWNESIDALRASLAARPDPPGFEVSPREHIELNRKLRARGLALAFGTVPGISWQLVAPGSKDGKTVEYAITGVGMVEQGLDARDADELLSRLNVHREPIKEAAWRFHGHWENGSAADAVKWVLDSDPRPDVEQTLCRFLGRFARETFYRDLPSAIDRCARAERVTLPRWLYEVRGVLAGVDPTQRDCIKVLFDGFDAGEPREERDRWYKIGLLGYDNEEQHELLGDVCGVFPIGQSVRPGESQLVIDLKYPDMDRVYDTRYLSLAGDRSAGRWPNARSEVAFGSYASMLGHIVAVEIDGRVVEAGPFVEV